MSFLNNLAKRAQQLGHTIGHDAGAVANTASRVYDQVNPLDNGLSYQTRQVAPNVPQRSVVQQALPIAQGFVRAPAQFVNTAVNVVPMADYTIRQNIAAHTNNPLAYQNATRNLNAAMGNFQSRGGLANVGTFINAPTIQHGSAATIAKKTFGNTLATEATIAPVGKIGAAFTKASAPLYKAIPTLAAQGGIAGGTFSAGQQLQDNGRINPKQLARDTAIGAALGGGLPLAGRAAGMVANKAADGAYAAGSRAKFQATERTGQTFNGLKPHQIITNPDHIQAIDNYQTSMRDGVAPPVQDQQHIVNALHEIKQNNGLDFLTGSPDARAQRIEQYQQQWHEGIKRYQQKLIQQGEHPPVLADENGGINNRGASNANKLKQQLGQVSKAMKAAQGTPGWDALAKKADTLSSQLEEARFNQASAKGKRLLKPLDQNGSTPVNGPLIPVGKLAKEKQQLPKTGVNDKQLNDLQTVHNQLVNTEAEDLKPIHQPTINPVAQRVRQAGGISSSAYEDIPKGVIRKSGASADKVAQELGYNSEDELINALQTERELKARTLSTADLKQKALENLQNGNSEHSADFAHLQSLIKQRQDELSLYPNGKYRQVKVLPKPAKMTDAELQSLAQTPEGMQRKTTNKVTVRNEKKVLRNADADRQVQQILSKGGNSEDALKAYMDATGADLQTAVKDVRRVANESNLGFNKGTNPLLNKVAIPEVSLGDKDQAFLNADFVKQHEQAIGHDALSAFHGLSEHDKTLLKKIETDTVSNVAKKADNPQAFLQAEHKIRTYYDTRHAYDNYLGIDVGYRTNYLRQIFDKAEEEAKASMPEQISLKAGNKNPGYKHERSYDTLNTHVGKALERDIAGSSANHAKLAYAKGLQEAFPDMTNDSGQLVRDTNSGGNFMQLTNKYGQGITAQKDLATQINSRTRTPTTSRFLDRYDKVNAGIKYAKLGGGAFHAVTEAGNFIGQQLTSGKFFTEPQASAKALGTFFSPKLMDSEMAKFRANGTLDNAALSGLKIMAKDILADANVTLGGKASKYTGIQALHDATFQREIPYEKLKMFEQQTQGLDIHNPQDLAKMRSVAIGINDLFGGINRDIEGGISPKSFKVLQRMVLATDFTEGKIKTALHGINITDNSASARLARQAIIGKALLFAGIATAGGALGGEFKGKSPRDVAISIAEKLADPSFHAGRYKVALPATHISEFSRPLIPLVHPATKGSAKGDRFAGLQHYATGRLASIPSEVYQLRTNKDYSGNKIYGKDYAFNGGEQIGAGKTALNVLSGFTPIPGSQAIGVAQKKTDPRAAVANTLGLRVTNEDQYNQNATPVTLPDGKTTLTKTQAINFNKSVADQRTTLDKQLMASDAYKKASPEVQKKKLASLNAAITSATKRTYAVKNNSPLDKQASASEQQILSGKVPSTLTKGSDKVSAGHKTTDLYKSNDAEFKALQDKYKTALSDPKTPATKKYEMQRSLDEAKIGASYSKNVRDLYGMGKTKLADYTTKNQIPQSDIDAMVAYGDALQAAGLGTNKYRDSKGNVSVEPKAKGTSSGRKSSGSRKVAKAKLPSFKATNTASLTASRSINSKVQKAKISSGSPRKVSFSTKIRKTKSYTLNRRTA